MSQLSNEQLNSIKDADTERKITNAQLIGSAIGGLVGIGLIIYGWKSKQRWWYYPLSLLFIAGGLGTAVAKLVFATNNS